MICPVKYFLIKFIRYCRNIFIKNGKFTTVMILFWWIMFFSEGDLFALTLVLNCVGVCVCRQWGGSRVSLCQGPVLVSYLASLCQSWFHLSAALCWLAAVNSEVNREKGGPWALAAVSAWVALSVLGSSSVEAQSGSLRPLRRTNGLRDASAVRGQAWPRGPAHTLQHTAPYVWLGQRSSALTHHTWGWRASHRRSFPSSLYISSTQRAKMTTILSARSL